MGSALRWACAWAILGLIGTPGLPASAGARARNVLVLYANGRLLPANIDFDRGLRAATVGSPNRPVELFEEFLDVPRFGGQVHVEAVAGYLRGKYASHRPDVIVTAGVEALRFVLLNRQGLYPDAPVVHAAVSRAELRTVPVLPGDVIGAPLDDDFSNTVDQALRWHPNARRLVIVTGTGDWDRRWEARLRVEVSRFEGRAAAEFLAGLPTDELLLRLARLGGESVVFTPGYFEDGTGRSFWPRDSAEVVAAAAPVPVYGPYSTFLGTGAVGGYVASFEAMGRDAGQVVNRLLDGAAPASLQLPEVTPTTLNVDWRQLRRWHIEEKAVPAGAVVHFEAPTFLEKYREEAIGAAAVFSLQAGLIGWLLVERRRRRAAELAEQARRFELAHASRVAVAGELTGAIAHEINQPLGAILSNADAAELILESGEDRRDTLRTILADIRRDDLRASEVIQRLRSLLAKHEVRRQTFDVNEAVTDARLLLLGEARRRRATIDVQPATSAITILGDRIQIQQVLLNLVLNAMDAVADAPEDRRTVVVSVEQAAGRVTIAVRDRGQGIAPEHLSRLFESFFSTKPRGMGLGLSISRTIVESHGGRIWAENGRGEGAVFHVELPAASEGERPPTGQA